MDPSAAKFSLSETPTGSPTKADATTHFASDELDLATISLDSEVHNAAPPEQPAASGAAQTADVTEEAPAAPAAPAPSAEDVVPTTTAAAAAAPTATFSQPPPELPKASPVKVRAAHSTKPADQQHTSTCNTVPCSHTCCVQVWVKDAEKVAGKLLASHISCLVRTECSKECALAVQAAVAGAAAAGSAEEAAAADSPSQQQQQPGPVGEGLVVFEVRRRFDDFELLSRLLKGHFRGYFIPRLPPRCVLGVSVGGVSCLVVAGLAARAPLALAVGS
jgi:hypothetical protein